MLVTSVGAFHNIFSLHKGAQSCPSKSYPDRVPYPFVFFIPGLHQLVFFSQRRNRDANYILTESVVSSARYFPFAAAGELCLSLVSHFRLIDFDSVQGVLGKVWCGREKYTFQRRTVTVFGPCSYQIAVDCTWGKLERLTNERTSHAHQGLRGVEWMIKNI